MLYRMKDSRTNTLRPASRARHVATRPRVPCIGVEAEFTVWIDGKQKRPEKVFGNPRRIVREAMIPRRGRSWHLPSGGALYFDTGVIEVATPIVEIGPGCAIRAVRSLWEQIAFVRQELDVWEKTKGVQVRLAGFSTHYNVSVPNGMDLSPHVMRRISLLLTYVLHSPVMLLAANRLSTGVGVRPREDRFEVTADFTPDVDLMIASAALITGMIVAIVPWKKHDLNVLDGENLPVIKNLQPRKHTSRKGYLARFDCFPTNPFATDPNDVCWHVRDGRCLSLRQIAQAIAAPFRRFITAASDSAAADHVFAVLEGRARSLLDFPDRPERYEDVGRKIDWGRRSRRKLPLSNYERVIHRVIAHDSIRIGRATYRPERMLDWYQIAFRNTRTGRRKVFTLDELANAAT
jgi:hypothetical protein